MANQIQIKRGLSSNFASVVLNSGEPAFLTDTGKLYLGDGTNKVLINPINKPSDLDVTNLFTKIKVNEYGQVVHLENLTAEDIPTISISQISGLGTSATHDVGIQAGNIPVLDAGGKLSSSTLPSIAITDTFVVSSESAMLALSAETGDIAIRTDSNETYVLKTTPASVLENWIKLLTPIDSVTSVNGKTGAVVLIPSDITMTSYIKAASYSAITPTDTLSVSVGKLEKNFDSYAPLASPIFTGMPQAPTATIGTNSTTIATTQFVTTATSILAPLASPFFTGNPKAPTQLAGDNSTNIATTSFVMSAISVIDGGTF